LERIAVHRGYHPLRVLLSHPKTTHRAEQRAPIVAILPHPDDLELLQFALALSHGDRRPLRAWTFHRLGSDLHPALRIARFGMTARSEADRAVRHLVESSTKGAHVLTRPFADDPKERDAEVATIQALPSETLLLVGRVRGRRGVDLAALRSLVGSHAGPVVIVVGRRGPVMREVLAVSTAPHEDPAHRALVGLIAALEQGYPTFRVRLNEPERLKTALADAGAVTLLVAAVDDDALFGSLTHDPPLWDQHPGGTALVFPPGGARTDHMMTVLERLTSDESPPPTPAREPLRWTRPTEQEPA
jgi:hypothetical protein